MSVNKAILLGRLGADPELRQVPSGQPVCELRVATNEAYTKANGERGESTQWHRVVVWGKTAESCKTHLGKGSEVFVEGRIQTRAWEDKEGKKRFTTEVVAERVQFLGGRPNGAAPAKTEEREEL